MHVDSPIERQQAIDYIKARLTHLSNRRSEVLNSCCGDEISVANQIKVIDGRVDHLLDALSALQRLASDPPAWSAHTPIGLVSNNFKGAITHGLSREQPQDVRPAG